MCLVGRGRFAAEKKKKKGGPRALVVSHQTGSPIAESSPEILVCSDASLNLPEPMWFWFVKTAMV